LNHEACSVSPDSFWAELIVSCLTIPFFSFLYMIAVPPALPASRSTFWKIVEPSSPRNLTLPQDLGCLTNMASNDVHRLHTNDCKLLRCVLLLLFVQPLADSVRSRDRCHRSHPATLRQTRRHPQAHLPTETRL